MQQHHYPEVSLWEPSEFITTKTIETFKMEVHLRVVSAASRSTRMA